MGSNVVGSAPAVGEEAQELLLGAPDIGERALLRFYVLHVYLLPALLTTLLAVHIWRVRKDGLAGGEAETVAAQAGEAETVEAETGGAGTGGVEREEAGHGR